jgi:hypothetical protein
MALARPTIRTVCRRRHRERSAPFVRNHKNTLTELGHAVISGIQFDQLGDVLGALSLIDAMEAASKGVEPIRCAVKSKTWNVFEQEYRRPNRFDNAQVGANGPIRARVTHAPSAVGRPLPSLRERLARRPAREKRDVRGFEA